MKKMLLWVFVLVFLGAVAANAQPTLTAANMNAVIGDSYKQQYLKTGNIPAPVTGGSNQTWDYTMVKDSVGVGDIFTYTAPTGLPGATKFPNATIAAYAASSYSYQYYKTTAKDFGYLGSCGKTSLKITRFTPQLTALAYPLTFNSIYNDSATLQDDSLPAGYNIIYHITLNADAYGTLKMPKGTYNNVLRVAETYQYDYFFNGTPITSGSTTNYFYYSPGSHSPLLTLYNSSGVWYGSYYTNTTLPLTTHNFTASWQNQVPSVQWIAENTTNTKGFNILRSTDGVRFDKVGFVAAHDYSTAYRFNDNYASLSTVYYRIEQVDKNGELFYSSTVALQPNSSTITYKAFPNPAKNEILLSIPAGTKQAVSIYSLGGKLVYQNEAYQATQAISIQSWTKGLYFVHIKSNGINQVSSFEKQ